MNCSPYNDYMMKYMDGNLNGTEHAELMRHINKCKACCTEFQEFNSIMKSFEEGNEIEPPDGFEISVMSRINLLNDFEKKKKEKSLVVLYFMSSMVFTLMMIAVAVIFKENVLRIMQYLGIPLAGTYFVYDVLSRIDFTVKLLVELIKYFNAMFTDIYYVLIGLITIAAMSKIYEMNQVRNNNEESTKTLQSE